MRRAFFSCLGALLALTLLGCGSKKGTIQGTVTLDGHPVDKGVIQFYPADDIGQTAGTVIGGDGHYQLESSIGAKKVVINSPKVIGHMKAYDTPDSPVNEVLAEALPARYNIKSELTADVKAGMNEVNFDLKSESGGKKEPSR